MIRPHFGAPNEDSWSNGGAGTTTFGYDALDRLTSAGYPNGDATAYGYDPVGNRTSQTINGVTTTNTFDAADRMTASGATTYTYDNDGNELTKTSGSATTTYSYDLLNRLTGISGPTTATYTYNGDGLRVAKTVGSTTTSYAWDPTGLGTVLSDGSEYVWGQGLVSQVTASGTTYALSDGLGSVRLLTDASGSVVGRQQYDAYGAPRSQSGAQLPFGFTGEQTDAESGLVYLRARYYDPATGRFLSPDPLGLAGGGTDLYAYVLDRPTAAVDPSGQLCFLGISIPGLLGGGCAATPTVPSIAQPSPSPTPTPGAPNSPPDWPIGPQPTPNPPPTPTPTPCPTPTPGSTGPTPVDVDPTTIRFSQSSVNDAAEIIDSMLANGWVGDPIDVVRMPDGQLTTVDNTRLLAARVAGIPARVVIHDFGDPLPPDQVTRFTTPKGGTPTSWGSAVLNRIGNQSASYRDANPYGSNVVGWDGS